MPFVVDASVAIKWIVTEPGSLEAMALLGTRLAAPDLLISECTNAVWRMARQGILTHEGTQAALTFFAGVPIELHPTRALMPRALEMAMHLIHPAHDCFYLALAEREDMVCVTEDLRFRDRVAGSEWAALVRAAAPS